MRKLSLLSLLPFLLVTASACSEDATPRSRGNGGDGGTPGSGTGGLAPGNGGSGSGIVLDPDAGTPPQNEDCDSVLQVTYRDFRETHPDFEMPFKGDVLRRGLVQPLLSADSKPVFLDRVGCPALKTTPLGCDNWTVTEPVITSAESFAQWYQTVPDVNIEIPGEIDLVETPLGSGQYVFESTAFFPLEASEGFGVTPAGHYMGKNFLFTTEAHVSFGYTAGQRFAFRGDDDVWIFVNGRLAMDLGSLHGPEEGVIDFDAQAAELGIRPGNTYRMDVFHAERHTDGSNFKFTTNIACFTTVVVR